MTNNLLILAGGASSRMKSSDPTEDLSEEEVQMANTTSKALIGFGKENRPILDFLLSNAEKAGYKNVYLIVGKDIEDFKNFYGSKTRDNQFKGLQISYATQHIPEGREKPFGTADAVTQALEQFPHLQSGAFTVCNCDNLYSVRALQALATTNRLNAFISYDREGLQFSMARISRFALVVLDNEGHLIDIIEKPTQEESKKYLDDQGKLRVSMNIFKLDGASLFTYLKNCPVNPERNEKELPSAILNYCTDHPKKFKAIPFKEHVPDLTSKEDILAVKKFINTQNDS